MKFKCTKCSVIFDFDEDNIKLKSFKSKKHDWKNQVKRYRKCKKGGILFGYNYIESKTIVPVNIIEETYKIIICPICNNINRLVKIDSKVCDTTEPNIFDWSIDHNKSI